ncbi:MAG: autotransporter domain-containing protein [Opitutales bacterium]
MKQLRLSFVAGVALFGLLAGLLAQSTPAPRSYSSYFFFGDSLTDMGNTYFVSGQPPPPYYNGRFSNGPTYAEYLVAGLQRSLTAPPSVTTNLNFAFAGATATTTYMGPTTPAYLGQEIGMYLARGLTPKPTDLFVVWAGANDVLNYLGSTATPSGAGANTSATASVTAVTSAVQTLATAGAKNFIVMTLPDISQTARFVTGSAAPAAALAQGAVYTYGTGIKTSMAGLAASTGASITVVDTTALLGTIMKNAAHFGFTDTTHDVVDILTAGGTVANPNSYIFWDGIHPTTAVHLLFAQALTEVINPEMVLGTAAAQSNTLSLGADLMADTVDNRLKQIRSSTGRHAADGFVSYNYADGGLNASGYRKQFTYAGNVVTGGFDAKVSDALTLGLALSADRMVSKVKPAAGSFNLNGELVTGYAQWKSSFLFVEATGGAGSANIDRIQRATALGGLLTSGKTTGTQSEFSLKAGGDFDLGGFHVTPFVGARYFQGRISAYTESDVAGLNFAFGSHDVKAATTLVGVNGTWSAHLGEMPLTLGVSGVYQASSSQDEAFSGSLADTVAPTTTITPDTAGGNSVKLGAYITGAFSKRWNWTIGYTNDSRKDGQSGNQAGFSLQTGF